MQRSTLSSYRSVLQPPAVSFEAERFTMDLYEDWTNETVYVIEGPLDHEMQHNITVNVDPDAGNIALIDYADVQIATQQDTLRGCRLLMKGFTQLDNATAAYRAIFVWYPTDERRIYQDQLFVVQAGVGYKLTANFTKKTRKTLGPRIERAMRSFEPRGVASGRSR